MSNSKYTLEIIKAAEEKDDALFVLFYAFYKDLASTHRLKIPTYAEMFRMYTSHRDVSYFFIASEAAAPIGMLWLTREKERISVQGFGSIMSGMEKGVDTYLLEQVIAWGKGSAVLEFEMVSEKVFPHPGYKQRYDSFHAILRQAQDKLL